MTKTPAKVRTSKRAAKPTEKSLAAAPPAAKLRYAAAARSGRGGGKDLHARPLRMRIEDNHDEARFLATWALGEPIIVEGVGERLRERWSPDALSTLHGDLEVPLVDTRSGQTFFRPLRDFLNGFRRPELRPRAPAKHHGGKKAAAASSSADDDESGPPPGGGASQAQGLARKQ